MSWNVEPSRLWAEGKPVVLQEMLLQSSQCPSPALHEVMEKYLKYRWSDHVPSLGEPPRGVEPTDQPSMQAARNAARFVTMSCAWSEKTGLLSITTSSRALVPMPLMQLWI